MVQSDPNELSHHRYPTPSIIVGMKISAGAVVTPANVGGATPAGTVEIMGQKIAADKADAFIAGLNLRPVYLVTNPRGGSSSASVSDGQWAALTPEQKRAIIEDAEVIFAAAAAGVQVMGKADKEAAKNLLVVADVNAVPPPGVEGMDLFMDGAPLPDSNALGVGPLAIGDIKYKTESGLFKQMINSKEALSLDFRHAFTLARQLTS